MFAFLVLADVLSERGEADESSEKGVDDVEHVGRARTMPGRIARANEERKVLVVIKRRNRINIRYLEGCGLSVGQSCDERYGCPPVT